jgi:hypothetical protein
MGIMKTAMRVLSTGAIAIAMGAGGLSVGLAQSGFNEPFLPLPTDAQPVLSFPLPSDSASVSGNTQFLTFSGGAPRLDSPISACEYYKTIGAVGPKSNCNTGSIANPVTLDNPITFEQWKSYVAIDKYAYPPGTSTDTAQFINKVDLNLTRDHHMISYGRDQLAAYVCNHKGSSPTVADPTGLFPSQSEIDALIADINLPHPKNLIACVAMEFSVNVKYDSKNPNPSGTPFTKFWIFGANGALLLNVDLDGRGLKGVPHVCTACHGGPFTSESLVGGTLQFDPLKSPKGDLGAHFLPFDMANFAFSSTRTKVEQEESIFAMNLNVYITESERWSIDPKTGLINSGFGSASIEQLIEGWYGDVTKKNVSPLFNTEFVPSHSWDYDENHAMAYLNAVSHSCRTCHVAMDHYPFEIDTTKFNGGPVCNPEYVMPNSKVTFDRFWLSQKTVPGQPVQLQDGGGQPGYLSLVTKQDCLGP